MLRSEKRTRDRASSFLSERTLRKIRLWGRDSVLALLVAWPLFGQDAPIQQGPPLKVSVNRVSIGVTVSDANGRFVRDLQRSDFRIYDNRTEQPIADFLPVEEPAQVLLLIEGGPSVLFFAKNHVLAADHMVANLAPDDRVAIATYTKGPESVIGFTTDKTAARLALRGISFAQGFGELNLFASVANAVDVLGRYPGKKTIVLLSTGVDTSPDINWAALLPKLQIADVRIIALSLSGDIRTPAKKRRLTAEEKAKREQLAAGFAEGDQSLRNLSRATGGRVYFVRNEKDFAKTYAEIADLLRHEYSLAFVPPVLDGKIHELRVEVKQPEAVVEYRPAYLAAQVGEVH